MVIISFDMISNLYIIPSELLNLMSGTNKGGLEVVQMNERGFKPICAHLG